MTLKVKEAAQSVGKAALELQKKDEKINAIDLQQEVHKGSNSKKSYEQEIEETIQTALKDSTIPSTFYVVVLTKKERLLKNIVRQYFFYRKTCPTPEYDQTVYQYSKEGQKLQFLWCVPNNATCQWLPLRAKDLPPDQRHLLHMIQSFNNGKLLLLAQRLNKELVI